MNQPPKDPALAAALGKLMGIGQLQDGIGLRVMSGEEERRHRGLFNALTTITGAAYGEGAHATLIVNVQAQQLAAGVTFAMLNMTPAQRRTYRDAVLNTLEFYIDSDADRRKLEIAPPTTRSKTP